MNVAPTKELMTSDERNLLTDLANKIAQTPPPPKDPEAEDFIRTKIGARPDALYLMTQTVIIQNIALQHAQQQIQELQRSSGTGQISSGPSSFLGQQQQPPRSSAYGQPGGSYAAPAAAQYAAPSPGGPGPSVAASGAPSFLRGAAQTAAGVAAGALAFEGIQHLFSHPGFGGGGMFGGGGIGGYGSPVEETVNNYYDNGPGNSGGGDYSTSDGRDDYQATDDATNVDDNSGVDDVDDSQYDDNGAGFDDNSGGDSFV
jgi:hypothetical protein